MKVLAIIAGGLGNQMQMTAALRTLRIRLGWDIVVISAGAPVAAAEMRDILPYPAYGPHWRPEKGEIDGVLPLTFATRRLVQDEGWFGLPYLNDISRQTITTATSEVDVSMNACRDLGIAEKDLMWHGALECPYPVTTERFDVVLANNYYKGPKKSPTHHWHVRGYPGFKTLAAQIRKRWPMLSMCCIGLDDRERIEGVTDRTGLSLADTLALIARARFLVSTDSMAFHAAACFDTPAFVLWTATSAVKSACPKFHDKAILIGRHDLECRQTCFARQQAWRRCKRWRCQEIEIETIMGRIAEEEGRFWEPREDANVVLDKGVAV